MITAHDPVQMKPEELHEGMLLNVAGEYRLIVELEELRALGTDNPLRAFLIRVEGIQFPLYVRSPGVWAK